MSEFVARRLRSGQTMRYHTVPQMGRQSVAEHTWRAMVLAHTLWPGMLSKEGLLWLMYHDSPEQELGDMPAPAKWNWPILADYYNQHEWQIEQELEIKDHYDDMSSNEKHITAMCDMLECIDYTAHRIMQGDHSYEARNIYWNGRKHMFQRFNDNVLFGPAHKFLEHLHAQVVQVCPAAAAHVG
jgi:5'-deoxynucleotidase YfbR-like HD superfamily hydrolase